VATHAINPWLYSKMPYNAATDFAPITQMVRVPNVLVINADTARRLNIHTLADLIKYAKANPAKLNYASGGNGSAGHLAGEMFKARAGIFAAAHSLQRRQPRAAGAAQRPGRLQLRQPRHRLGQHQGRQAQGPGGHDGQRSALLPDVPAVAETLKGFEIDTWWGLVAPAGTPKDVVAKLNQVFVAALNSPEAKTRFATLMAEPVGNTPEQFGAFMKSELAKYEKVVKASGAKVD
jgi:tripartite-type tricarboxylate transporter receptor subunit TctC